MVILETNQLTKVYGGTKGFNSTTAINGINIKVNKGEFVAVMGPSGSGKTTLLNLLSGIDHPSSGDVFLMGQNVHTMKKTDLALFRRQNLGFVFQDFNLLDSLTLMENIMLPLILDRKDHNIMDQKVKGLMQFFNIEHIKNKYPYHVSGGEQQRTSACRALVNDPKMILADEPTGNLDSKSSHQLMQNIEQLNKERETTVLMVTHDPFAASFCNRIIFIQDGQVALEIYKKENRKIFFERILDSLAIIGGETR